MEKIYILKKQKLMLGPYSINIIKERGLKKSDLIWYDGLEDWTPVQQLADMSKYITAETKQHQPEKSFLDRFFGFLK